ncbi:MAG TPA: hypothetical protein PLQ15_05885 [Syntrophales bacterium]|nr:hypothetical protein [Syntrophales bacterium]
MGNRQKACREAPCRKKRKQQAQQGWSEKNPGYFRGRYGYVKEWRRRRRMIQDEIPWRRPEVEYVLRLPASMAGGIQDEIRLQRVDSRTFAARGP